MKPWIMKPQTNCITDALRHKIRLGRLRKSETMRWGLRLSHATGCPSRETVLTDSRWHEVELPSPAHQVKTRQDKRVHLILCSVINFSLIGSQSARLVFEKLVLTTDLLYYNA